MGCAMTKEKLQTEILVLQLEKAEIQEKRERLLRQLELLNKKKQKQKENNNSQSSGKSTNNTG